MKEIIRVLRNVCSVINDKFFMFDDCWKGCKSFTVGIRYLEYQLSRFFTMSNSLFGLFSILINFRSVFLTQLSRTFTVSNTFLGPFSHFWADSQPEHSNGVFEWIILLISGILMLTTALTKLCSEDCSFFFSTRFRQQHVLS